MHTLRFPTGSSSLLVDTTNSNRCCLIDTEPVPGDFEMAEVGLMILVRLSDLKQWSPKQGWETIPAGVLVSPVVDDVKAEPFHFHPSLT